MTSNNLKINVVFTIVNVLIFFILGKLLLFLGGLGLPIDQQTNNVTTVLFLVGGILCSIYVIHKNTSSK